MDIAGHGDDGLGDLLGAAHAFSAPGDGPEHGQLGLGFVEEPLPFAVVERLDLAGDQEHAAGGELRLVEARHRIGGPGAGAGDRHAKPACCPGVAIGSMEGALLMADGDRGDAAEAVNGIVDGDIVDADDTEDVFDAKGAQGFVDGFAAGHFAHGCLRGHR